MVQVNFKVMVHTQDHVTVSTSPSAVAAYYEGAVINISSLYMPIDPDLHL